MLRMHCMSPVLPMPPTRDPCNRHARHAPLQVAIAVETRKKAVMDRHLDMIVGQTERYSKMLASNLLLQHPGKGAQSACIIRTCPPTHSPCYYPLSC